MSEVEKMYENTKLLSYYCGDGYIFDAMLEIECTNGDKEKCKTCDKAKTNHPPFTAEKQLELIKLLQRKNGYKFSPSSTNDNSEYLFFAHKDNTPVQELIVAGDKCYEEALAGIINTLWQNLTEEECKQIKEILNG